MLPSLPQRVVWNEPDGCDVSTIRSELVELTTRYGDWVPKVELGTDDDGDPVGLALLFNGNDYHWHRCREGDMFIFLHFEPMPGVDSTGITMIATQPQQSRQQLMLGDILAFTSDGSLGHSEIAQFQDLSDTNVEMIFGGPDINLEASEQADIEDITDQIGNIIKNLFNSAKDDNNTDE